MLNKALAKALVILVFTVINILNRGFVYANKALKLFRQAKCVFKDLLLKFNG